jgi:UDP-glucose 4-epimerase
VADDRLIVITGAGGHVGGRLLKYFCTETEHRVRPHFRNQSLLPVGAADHSPTTGDLRDEAVRRRALDGADVVIHLATRGYSTSQPPTPGELAAERIASIELVRDAADSGVSRFIFISSIHVYGDALIGAVTGFTTPQPATDYGRSRLQLERELTRQSEATAMTRVVLRMANTFGIPAMTQPATWDLLVHDLCRQAVVSNRLVLHSNGTGYRNFLALSDAVSVIAKVATHNVPSGTYVLTGPKTYRLRDIAELVRVRAELLLGKSLAVEVSSTDMTHHQPFTIIDTSLRAFGISMQDSLVGELDQLIRAAYQEFGDQSS